MPAVRYLQMRVPLSVRLDRRPGVDVVGVVEVRQFAHGGLQATELLSNGAVPMDIMNREVDRWIQEKLAAP